MSDWQVQYAERMEAADRDGRCMPVIRSACHRLNLDIPLGCLVELMAFLESWDGPGVTEERLVGYAVDWLTNP
jgi:hypothetical protein